MLRYRPTQYLSCSPGDLQLLEQSVAAGDLDLAGRLLDIELLHHAVLDQHGIALRADAEPIARAVEGQIHRLGEFAVSIGEELDLVGCRPFFPARPHENDLDAGSPD